MRRERAGERGIREGLVYPSFRESLVVNEAALQPEDLTQLREEL